MVCPLCKNTSRRLFQKHGYWIRECEGCSHQFAEITHWEGYVDRIYGDHYFRGGGAGYPDYFNEEKLLVAHGRRYARLMSNYSKPGRVLDVGAAAGFILKGFEEMGWIAKGIEPNIGMVNHARSRLGLDVEACTLEEFRSSDQYDLICMIQVVAHFVDPRQAFRVAEQLTKPGGFWLIETWDRRSWTARCLGQLWHEYSPPSVLHWFSAASLRHLAREFELREVAHGRPMKWIRSSHAKAIAVDKLGGASLGRLILGVSSIFPNRLPVPYLMDDVFWALCQKSSFAPEQ